MKKTTFDPQRYPAPKDGVAVTVPLELWPDYKAAWNLRAVGNIPGMWPPVVVVESEPTNQDERRQK